MKPIIPRLIAFGTIFIMALICVLTSMTSEALIAAAILLAIFAIAILAGSEKSVISTAPVIVLGWITFGVMIPSLPSFDTDVVATAIADVGEYIGYGFEEPIAVMGLAAFIAAQLFLRKSDNIIFIVLRYIACAWMTITISAKLFPSVLYVLAPLLLNLSLELRSKNGASRKPRSVNNVFVWILTMLVYCLNPAMADYLFTGILFTGDCVSIYTIIGIAVLAGLMIMEDNCTGLPYYLSAFEGHGAILLYWCAMAVLMLLLPSLANRAVLLIAPLVLFHCFHLFYRAFTNYYVYSNEKVVFHVVWVLICVGILGLSKSINIGNLLVSVSLAVAPIAAVICWVLSREKGHESQVMSHFLGIVAVILLAVSGQYHLSDPLAIAQLVLVIATLCVFWCLLSARVHKLKATASAVDKHEFDTLAKIHGFAPMAVLVIALLKILISNPVV